MRHFFFLITLLLLACQPSLELPKIDENYLRDFDQFLVARQLENEGYLKLCGLTKLPPLTSSYGSDSINDIFVSVVGIDGSIGFFSNTPEGVFFYTEQEVQDQDGLLIDSVKYTFDERGNSQKLFLGDLSWRLITRSNEWYVRSWDEHNPAVGAFEQADRFDLTEEYIFSANFEYFDEPIKQTVSTQLGPPETTYMVGEITFEYRGESHTLDVGSNGFTMVGDVSTGQDTYGGGRYIDLTIPDESGPMVLDFNRLYNPPCTFSDFTTCQYPPEQNVLPFRIEAGEKYSGH